MLASKLADFRAALPSCDVVILSDYGKGGLAHIAKMIGLARAAGKRVLVDPKGDDWSRYKGAHVVTPNRKEFAQVAGHWKDEPDLERRARRLRAHLRLKALLVTRGDEGMSLYTDKAPLHVKAEAREVYDVSGALPEFQRLYQDIPGYIKQVAIEANREVLGPHLAQQATQTRDAMLAQARAGVDGEYGDGTWDEHFSKDVLTTIKDLPLEMQASRQHLEAAIAAVLGRQYLDPAGAEKLDSRRSKAKKAKEESMNMLPNGRPRPSRPDQLDDRERAFLDSLQRSGIDYDESRYKTAKGAGRTIEEWEAANAPKKGK